MTGINRKVRRKYNQSEQTTPAPIPLQNNLSDLQEEKQETNENLFLLDTENRDTVDQEFKNWLEENNYLDSGFIATLYKYDSPLGGVQKSICGQWGDTIPGEHEIGLTYGSGRYIMLCRVIDQEGKNRIVSRKFRIHGHYDKLAANSEKVNPATTYSGANFPIIQNAGNNLNQTISLMREIFAMISPLINKQTDPNISGLLAETYKTVNHTMRESMLDNAQLYNDMVRKMGDMETIVETNEEVSSVQNIINTVAPLVEKFLPLILGKGPQSRMTIQGLKSLPEYSKIVNNENALRGLVSYIEKEKGKDIAGALLKKLKISLPE